MKKVFVTGAAGFIGSNLVDSLLSEQYEVVGWDNFSTGSRMFLECAVKNRNFKLIEGDNLDPAALTIAMDGCDTVFHLAANADVRFGLDHPRKDLEQNTIATSNVLGAMRANGIRRIAFPSTGSVYGEARVIPTPEDCAFPIQTSLYAASKVACECLIEAHCEGFGFEGYIFRFVSILGPRYTHGHVIDFYRQLRDHPEQLDVLGDGKQRKSYLNVKDCVRAILHVMGLETARRARHSVEVYNLGTDEYCTVTDSIGWICGALNVRPELRFAGGDRGWVGDNPFIFLAVDKIRGTGWNPHFTIRDSVLETVEWLKKNEHRIERPI